MLRTTNRRLATTLLPALLTGVLAGALLVPTATAGEARPKPTKPFPSRIELPDGFQPEGIAIGGGPTAYLGSLADGDIYQASLRTGRGRVISEGDGSPAVGLALGRRGRLFAAGGDSGTAKVVNTRTGAVVADWTFSAEGSFVNDVVLTRRHAYFTDSSKPVLYRVALGRRGAPADDFAVLPLTGAWVQPAGFGANGIETTPRGRRLIVVNSTEGALYRVGPFTGVARKVDLGGYAVTNGDGLLRRGRTLYVVQNRLNTVAVIRLDRRGTSGTLRRTISSDDFDVPTTVARFGRSLYLPNARFGTEPTATTDYWVTRVHR